MKNFISFIADFAILFVGHLIFPQYIVLNNWKDAVLATLIWWGITIIISLVAGIVVSTASAFDSITMMIIGLIVLIVSIMISSFIGLLCATLILDNFELHGFWTWIIIIILSALFSENKIDVNTKES